MIYLHKFLPIFLSPIFLVLLLVLYGLAVERKRPIIIAMTLLYIFSTPLVSDRIFYLLENSIQKPSLEEIPKAEAIVVLSGMISYVKAGTHSGNEWSDPDRFFAGIDLFNENKANVLVFTEASLPWSRSEIAEGSYLKMKAMSFGIDDNNILVTEKVQNTKDEAIAVLKALKNIDLEIILITSAFHMPRAKNIFEQQGFKLIPYPVDYKVTERDLTVMDFFPSSQGLHKTSVASRELIGRTYYKVLSWLSILS